MKPPFRIDRHIEGKSAFFKGRDVILNSEYVVTRWVFLWITIMRTERLL
jgi:hypothetical protein